MDIQTHTEFCDVTLAYSLLHVAVTDKVVAYKLGRGPLPGQVLPQQLAGLLSLKAEEGLTTRRQIQDFLGGRSTGIKPIDKLHLAHPEFLTAARELGFTQAYEALEKKKLSGTSNQPFTDFTEGRYSAANLVEVDYSSHMLFDPEGNSLPVAVHCDYIGAMMRDGAYHLDKAVEILLKDPRIRFSSENKRMPRGPSEYLHDVPYYNRSAGCSQYLNFWYMPTAEDAKLLWDKQRSYGGKYPSTEEHRAMFDLDILGLRAGGAAKYDSFYATDACPDIESDD